MKNVGKISIIFFKKMFEPNILKFSVFLLLLFSVGCSDGTVSITPACTTKVRCSIDVPTTFIGFCSKFFEGGNAKDLRVEVTVDGVSMDNNQIKTQLLDKFTFNKTNDFSLAGQFMALPVDLPSCGTYVVIVTIRGKDNTCFKCCHSEPRIPLSGQCRFNANGIINYRAVSTQINATAANPPPTTLQIEPLPVDCTDCGC